MGDSIRKCPLCCDQMFTSKNELIKHLNEVSGNLLCPFCNNSGYSVAQLIEHLTLDNCQANIAVSDTNNKLVFQIGPDTGIDQVRTYKSALEYEDFSVTKKEVSDIDPKPVDDPFGNIDSPGIEEDDAEINKMYVELISKQLTKPCLQTQEIRLVKDRYVIVSNEAAEASLGSRVVTKQNNDGTISLTTVKDMKLESDTLITQEKDADDNQEEVYSCNSCGVSFTSVIEHIQNYHNDQDVVVEDPLCASLPMEMNDEDSADKQTPRRMITETGDIVETPAELTNISLEPRNENASPELSDALKAPVTDKNVVVYTRPCVEIDNGNIVKNGAETVKKGPYHKVVMKQMQTTGGDTVKVFNCTTCNLYVSTLEDFKGHPCKPEPPSAETVSEESDPTVKQITPDKDGRKRAYVQIEKFCDSIIKDVNEPDENKGPYHKVVMKDLQTTSGETIKVYNCMTCNLYVSSLEDFKSQPCKLVKYSCPNCPVSYKNYKSLSAHMKIHKPPKQETGTTPTQALFECEVCATIFPTNKSLKLHKRMHDPIKARPIEPPSDTSTDKFLCNICGKHIPTYYREVHQNSHRNVDMFNCDICNKKFQSSEYLEMHMTVHTTDKAPVSKQDKSLPYICLYCGRRFARPHEKVKHERIHTGERPHSCEICGKSFRVSYCLTLHMRTHTGARPYACQHCGKRFKAHSVYNHHLLTHSEVRAYKCPYCPKAFKTSVQLAGHKNSHTKPFSCQHCNRPFASLYAVRVHTETHLRHNNLRYSCTQCGASYARSFALKDHMKQHEQQQNLNLVERVSKTDDWVKPPEGNEALEVEVASPPPGAEEVSLM